MPANKIDLAKQIVQIAGTPTEVGGGAHAAAQSALAGMGVDLAKLVLEEAEA